MPFPRTIAEFNALVPDEETAEAILVQLRWGGRPTCIECGSKNVTRLSTRRVYQCECRYQFTVRTHTVLHRTRIPLRTVLYIVWRCVDLASTSAAEIARELGLRYDTVWAIAQKVRASLAERGAWQIERAFSLGAISIPAPKAANGDPPHKPPVLIAVALAADPMSASPDVIRFETPSYRARTPDELCAEARHHHVHPLAVPTPAPAADVRDARNRLVGWLTRRYGGVSRKYLANYLALYAYTENRGHRSDDLLLLGLRRIMQEPWRPRSDLALPAA